MSLHVRHRIKQPLASRSNGDSYVVGVRLCLLGSGMCRAWIGRRGRGLGCSVCRGAIKGAAACAQLWLQGEGNSSMSWVVEPGKGQHDWTNRKLGVFVHPLDKSGRVSPLGSPGSEGIDVVVGGFR